MVNSAKHSRAASKTGLRRRGVYHRAGRRPAPLAPRNDGGGDPTLNHPALAEARRRSLSKPCVPSLAPKLQARFGCSMSFGQSAPPALGAQSAARFRVLASPLWLALMAPWAETGRKICLIAPSFLRWGGRFWGDSVPLPPPPGTRPPCTATSPP